MPLLGPPMSIYSIQTGGFIVSKQWTLRGVAMTRLPVIVGFGGYNSAGRSSFHQGFQRMVLESLSEAKHNETVLGLATMMGIVSPDAGQYKDHNGTVFSADGVVKEFGHSILDETLVRYYDNPNPPSYTDNWYEKISVRSAGQLPSG